MRSLLFWGLFTVAAVWGQYMVPGTDFFAAGLIVSLQEQGRARSLWLALFWILLQEGMGSLAFGTIPLLYGVLFLGFHFGRWLFDPRNYLFICLLGLFFGIAQAWLGLTMATLQGVLPDRTAVLTGAAVQVTLLPLEWALLFKLYENYVKRHADRVKD